MRTIFPQSGVHIKDKCRICNHPYGRETEKPHCSDPYSSATYNAQHTDTYEANEIERYQHTVEPRKNRQWCKKAALDAGAQAYLIKPVGVDALLDEVEKLITKPRSV